MLCRSVLMRRDPRSSWRCIRGERVLAVAVCWLALGVAVSPANADTLERVSVAGSGAEGNSHSGPADVSADGRFVAFASHATNLVAGDTNGLQDLFVHDRDTGVTERVNVGPGGVQA